MIGLCGMDSSFLDSTNSVMFGSPHLRKWSGGDSESLYENRSRIEVRKDRVTQGHEKGLKR